VDVADENIIRRMSGRRVCPVCGATFHLESLKPKKEGICDKCGAELIQRADDQEETVKKRLEVYHEQTQPLIDYYTEEGILKTFDGSRDIQVVFEDIVKVLEG
jgi:adenylate kinase